ncbi:MAG: hypothetical protein ACR2OZ_16315 [Verrucomicrobiales bacterium]
MKPSMVNANGPSNRIRAAGGGITISDPPADPDLARQWIITNAARRPLPVLFDEILRFSLPEAAREAALGQIFEQAVSQQQAGVVAMLAENHRSLLRSSTMLWGTVGGALAVGPPANQIAAVEWMSDWENRSDLQPWMLVNLIHALDAIEGPERSAAARRHLVDKAGPFPDRHLQEVALGFWVALTGSTDSARDLLGQWSARQLPGYYGFLKCLARLALEARAATAFDLAKWRRIEAEFTNAKSIFPWWSSDPGLAAHVKALQENLRQTPFGSRLSAFLDKETKKTSRGTSAGASAMRHLIPIGFLSVIIAGLVYFAYNNISSRDSVSNSPSHLAPEQPEPALDNLRHVPMPAPAGFRFKFQLHEDELHEVLYREHGDEAILSQELPPPPAGQQFTYFFIEGKLRPVLVTQQQPEIKLQDEGFESLLSDPTPGM